MKLQLFFASKTKKIFISNSATTMTIENFHLCLSEIYAIGFPEELFRQIGFTLTNPPTELARVGLHSCMYLLFQICVLERIFSSIFNLKFFNKLRVYEFESHHSHFKFPKFLLQISSVSSNELVDVQL